MPFGLAHQLYLAVVAMLGMLAMGTNGVLPPAWLAGLLVGLSLAFALPHEWRASPLVQRVVAVASVALLPLQILRVLSGEDFLVLAIQFVGALQVLRTASRSNSNHDWQILLIALVHLVAGSVVGGGLAYAACFLAFVLTVPGALLLNHLHREVEGNYHQGARDRAGSPVDLPRILRSRRVVTLRYLGLTSAFAIPILLFTGLLFILFPRVSLVFFAKAGRSQDLMVGFTDQVQLGRLGELRFDQQLAARVTYASMPETPAQRIALYLRGATLDRFDGLTWSRSYPESKPLNGYGSTYLLRSPAVGTPESYHVELRPLEPPVLLLPLSAAGFRVDGDRRRIGFQHRFTRDGADIVRQEAAAGPDHISYEVLLSPPARAPALTNALRARYLQVPATLSPKMRALADELVPATADQREVVQAALSHFRVGFRYATQQVQPPAGRDPLDYFLFTERAGHCEYYSTALAMLLRLRGIPTRNVTGFLGATFNPIARFYAIRNGDAHSWVEAYLDNEGWVTLDATPPATAELQSSLNASYLRLLLDAMARSWDQNVAGYDLDNQTDLLRTARDAWRSAERTRRLLPQLALAAAVVAIALAAYRWRHQRVTSTKRAREQILRDSQQLHGRIVRAFSRVGISVPSGIPLLEHAENLRALGHPCGEAGWQLVRLYADLRFGGRPNDSAFRRDLQIALLQLERLAEKPGPSTRNAAA